MTQDRLKKAEVIPTGAVFINSRSCHRSSHILVIDDFLPSLTISVDWPKKAAKLGNTINPKKLQDQPTVTLHDSTSAVKNSNSNLTYVVTLTDPDAPSRDDPKWSEMCHWIAANLTISITSSLDDVTPYKPPGPPPKTGKHRYVFLVFAPKNGTSESLHLSKPEERQHWGTGKERGGVREWAAKNGLVPVAANFVYAKNKEQ